MTDISKFSQTHKSVENKPFFFKNPEVTDIVKCFNKIGIITRDFASEIGDSNRHPFEVTDVENGSTMMAFKNEIEVIAKPISKVLIMETNLTANIQVATQIAIAFNEEINLPQN